jgi:hypothetical protein
MPSISVSISWSRFVSGAGNSSIGVSSMIIGWHVFDFAPGRHEDLDGVVAVAVGAGH